MKRRLFWLLVASLCLFTCRATKAGSREVTLAAAASLRGVLPELVRAYQAGRPGAHLVATFGASGDLKQQVEAGAPIDAVLLAAARPVDDLAAKGRVDPASRRVLATNVLVLIGPSASPDAGIGGRPLTFATLDALPAGERIAVGDPASVPAGDYARAWLTTLGKWDALEGRLLLGSDVAAVLTYARRGEVAAAVVYKTEVRGVHDVVILDEARGPTAPRPEVVGAVVRGAPGGEEAGAFLGFVASPESQRILGDFGFGPP